MVGATILEEQGMVILQEEMLNIKVAKCKFGDVSSVWDRKNKDYVQLH